MALNFGLSRGELGQPRGKHTMEGAVAIPGSCVFLFERVFDSGQLGEVNNTDFYRAQNSSNRSCLDSGYTHNGIYPRTSIHDSSVTTIFLYKGNGNVPPEYRGRYSLPAAGSVRTQPDSSDYQCTALDNPVGIRLLCNDRPPGDCRNSKVKDLVSCRLGRGSTGAFGWLDNSLSKALRAESTPDCSA